MTTFLTVAAIMLPFFLALTAIAFIADAALARRERDAGRVVDLRRGVR